MKKTAVILAIAAALSACSKEEPASAPVPKAVRPGAPAAQPVRTFPSVYEQDHTKFAAAAFEKAVKELAALPVPEGNPRELRELEVFQRHEAAREALFSKLSESAARAAASREVVRKALTAQERNAYNVNVRRTRFATRANSRAQAAGESAG